MTKIYRVQTNKNGAPNFSTAEEVVRCKECKHWCKGDDVYGICYRCTNTRQMRFDDFCSRGKRKGK